MGAQGSREPGTRHRGLRLERQSARPQTLPPSLGRTTPDSFPVRRGATFYEAATIPTLAFRYHCYHASVLGGRVRASRASRQLAAVRTGVDPFYPDDSLAVDPMGQPADQECADDSDAPFVLPF